MRGHLEDTVFPKKYFPKTQEYFFFFFNATQMAIPNNNYDDFLKKILGLTLDYELACYQEKILIETQP